MKYRRRLGVVLAIVCVFVGIFFMLVNMCDAQQDFAKQGINIDFILSLILGCIFFYWTFEARAYKSYLLASMACFILSISYFLMAIRSYYITWKFRDISSIISIVLNAVAVIIFLVIEHRNKKNNRHKT